MLFDDDDAFLETELCSAESLHYAWPSFPLLNSRNALVSSTETSEISIWGEHPCQQASRRESLTFTFFSYDSFPTDPRKGFLSRPLWSSWRHSRAGLSSTLAEKARGQPLGAAGPPLEVQLWRSVHYTSTMWKSKSQDWLSTVPKGYKRRSVLWALTVST